EWRSSQPGATTPRRGRIIRHRAVVEPVAYAERRCHGGHAVVSFGYRPSANLEEGSNIMQRKLNRREFAKALAVGLGAVHAMPLWAQRARRLKVGHTGITWGFAPEDAEGAIR